MPERSGHNVLDSRMCCATERFGPHAPSCSVLLDAKAAVEVARERLNNLLVWDLDAAASIIKVLELCDEWDKLSKGESGTTKAIRAAIYGDR